MMKMLLKWSSSTSSIKLCHCRQLVAGMTNTINRQMTLIINRVQPSRIQYRALQTLATDLQDNISHNNNVILKNSNIQNLQSTNRQSKRKYSNNNSSSSSSSSDDEKFITESENKSNFFTKTEILEIYKSTFKATYSGGEVDPKGVFTNNELSLSDIDIYGFDYDYTLACYKESLDYLIYDLGRDVLINKFQYPKDIELLDYIPDFAIRGLHYDIENGFLMKIDTFHQIQLGSVYRGLSPVPSDEIIRLYNGLYIPRQYIRGDNYEENVRMKQLNDLFSVPEMCLLSNVTENFIQNNIPYYPEILYHDVTHAIRSIHPVIHKMLDLQKIPNYLEKNERLPVFLEHLRKNNKKVFLITNSPFHFVDNGMKYMIGNDWRSLFDVIVVQARKPSFFKKESRPFRTFNLGSDRMNWNRVSTLDRDKIYMEGTVSGLLKMTGWNSNRVIYFGDQIYSDLADITLNFGWRTGAIIAELEKEIETHNSPEFKEAVSALQALQQLVDEGNENNVDEAILNQLIQQRDALRFEAKTLFNPQFGSIFRTHHNPTYFSRRLFRYSDIYMSQLTNLLKYSLKHTFLPRRGLLPHETRISQVELIHRGEFPKAS
uniref:5'-nucleotidase domain-containing protein 3-like n=2 Tax=Dermatophagoides pteronyssinus TaxID=6956 RepID=A0A6P6Y999_DERPT|nr:5'-nucleotidase domain-containing protein 3-like [Dermatophagoides pteronyssinus]